MDSVKFSELVRQLKAGNNELLKSIFEAHSSYCIHGLLSRHSCSRQDAEDIYIDSILNFRDKIVSGNITVITDLKNYLYATCQNMFLARLSKAQRVYNAAVEISRYSGGIHDTLNDEDDFKEQMISLTKDGLSDLGDKCRDILTSFYFVKLSLEEIAVKFNMANANVAKVSKSRCFQQLVNNIRSIRTEKFQKPNVVKQG
jgi:RNA polymerase sigma factor (sigma-70 family)